MFFRVDVRSSDQSGTWLVVLQLSTETSDDEGRAVLQGSSFSARQDRKHLLCPRLIETQRSPRVLSGGELRQGIFQLVDMAVARGEHRAVEHAVVEDVSEENGHQDLPAGDDHRCFRARGNDVFFQ